MTSRAKGENHFLRYLIADLTYPCGRGESERRVAGHSAGSLPSTIMLAMYSGIGFRMRAMRTGELARNAGVNLQTIRFYEREGLLPKPARTASGYRSYQESDLERVIFIRRNQDLGFTLAEIKQLMELHSVLASMGPKQFRRRPSELQGIIEIGRERLQAIKKKSRMLNTMRRQLEWVLQQLESTSVVACPARPPEKHFSGCPKKSA